MAKKKKPNRVKQAVTAAKRTGILPNTTKVSQVKAAIRKLAA